MRILIADDHAIVREGVKQILKTLPEVCNIDEVGEGTEALLMINKVEYDLVILDISMPGMSGLDILQADQGGERAGHEEDAILHHRLAVQKIAVAEPHPVAVHVAVPAACKGRNPAPDLLKRPGLGGPGIRKALVLWRRLKRLRRLRGSDVEQREREEAGEEEGACGHKENRK